MSIRVVFCSSYFRQKPEQESYFFLDHKEFDYSVSEIAAKTGLSFRTVLRELLKLERTGLIIQSRKVSNAAMYRIETNLHAVTLLDKLSLELSRMPAFGGIEEKVTRHEDIDELLKETSNKMQ